jgi:hypothetical protein
MNSTPGLSPSFPVVQGRKERKKAFYLNFLLIPYKAWRDASTGRKLTEEDSFHRMNVAL